MMQAARSDASICTTLSDPEGSPHPDRSILVTDTGTHAVHRFDAEAHSLELAGAKGTDHSMLWRPAGVAVDTDGDIFILDHGNHRCQVFKPDGRWIMSF